MYIDFLVQDKVLLFLVDIIYLFVLVLAGEWSECNSGNYYQFTQRGNPHLVRCDPRVWQQEEDAAVGGYSVRKFLSSRKP